MRSPALPMIFLMLPGVVPAAIAAADSPYAATALPDEALAQLRGGVLLPNGLDVALGFDLRTLVDGQLALHTVLSTEEPAPNRLRVLVGTQIDPMPVGTAVELPGSTPPELVVDRRGAGTSLIVSRPGATPVGGTVVNVVTAPRESWPAYPGETDILPAIDGPPLSTPLGAVTLTQRQNGSVVTLSSDSLVVQHFIGQATGIVVANAASDRRIDTISTIDVDLKGGWVAAANGLFSVNAIVANAATLRR